MKFHPNDLLLHTWASSPTRVSDEVAEHVAACARCRERARAGDFLRRLAGRPEDIPKDETAYDYGAVFDRTISRSLSHQRKLAREKIDAPALAARLLALPPARRPLLFENSRRCQTWGVCDWLVEESLNEEILPEAQEGQAMLAFCLSRHLDDGIYGADHLEDLRARAWGSIGRARHLAGDLDGAEAAFRSAARHLVRGTCDGIERAFLLETRAPLLATLGRLPSAIALLKRAARLYAEAGELPRAGRCLISQAILRASGGAGRFRRRRRRLRRLAIS